jgi:putative methionine-R-sulfoxide reductase with GAF domain
MTSVHSKADAEGEPDQLRRIEAVTDAELAQLTSENLLDTLLERSIEVLGADTAAILLLDPTGRELVATAAKGLEEEVRYGVRIPVRRGFAGRIAAEGRPMILDRVDETTVVNPVLTDKGIRALVGVPLIANGVTLGVLHVGSLDSRTFTPEDASLLQLVADRAALAISGQRSEQEHRAAIALQRSLLPAGFPEVSGMDIAARYVPGEHGMVSGDWYDVFTLPDGQLVAVIGDVVGHGLMSAVVMGRLRSAVRAYALEDHDPASVLRRLDRMVSYFETDEMATVLYATVPSDRTEIVVSSAGHPAPVLAPTDAAAFVVDAPPDLPIGVDPSGSRRNTTIEVPPGATLYLYTDGVVERRGAGIVEGIERLCTAAAAGSPRLGCARIMAELIGDSSPDDDVALLGVHFQPD